MKGKEEGKETGRRQEKIKGKSKGKVYEKKGSYEHGKKNGKGVCVIEYPQCEKKEKKTKEKTYRHKCRRPW